MRCDVCSSGEHEFRFFAGSFLIPNADYIRSDCNGSVWVVAFDWGGFVNLKSSAGLNLVLTQRSATNWGGVRYCLDGTFHVLVTVPGASGHEGRIYGVSGDGSTFLGLLGGYSVDPTKSPDILDINEDGSIVWWQDMADQPVDGLETRDQMTRNGRTVCKSGGKGQIGLGASVFNGSGWFKVAEVDIQIYPRIAKNGTVAISDGDVGFVPMSQWALWPFDPHETPDPPDPNPPDPGPIPGPDPIPPQPEPPGDDMTRSAVFVDNKWHTVGEEAHQDAGDEFGPLVGVRRKSDGLLLKIRSNGDVLFEAGEKPGADERLIPVPGGYYAERPGKNVLIPKGGPWTQ